MYAELAQPVGWKRLGRGEATVNTIGDDPNALR
jgi:hypothetical protein